MNALKNNKLVAVPDHLIIRNVNQMLNDHDQQQQQNKPPLPTALLAFEHEQTVKRGSALKERINYSLQMLWQYSQALTGIRQQHTDNNIPTTPTRNSRNIITVCEQLKEERLITGLLIFKQVPAKR